MGSREQERSSRVDAWLAEGGTVLASSERAVRALARTYEGARRGEGRTAWETPVIFSWESWVREQWLARSQTGAMLLNPLQEQSLWERVIESSQAGRGLLQASRLATAAQQAYRLLADFAPEALRPTARSGWTGDAATFSAWMSDFEAACRGEAAISPSRVGQELAEMLAGEDPTARSPLLLIGFDRLTRTQQAVLDAWGTWELDAADLLKDTNLAGRFFAASGAATEMAACVTWLRERLAENSQARLMVVMPGLRERRGELERALLAAVDQDGKSVKFEFSLGVPLGRLGGPRAAMLLLRWLRAPLSEPELDWLLTSGHCAANSSEVLDLARCMRDLRKLGRERPEWPLEVFLEAGSGGVIGDSGLRPSRRGKVELPKGWAARMQAAREQLRGAMERLSPLEWAPIAALLLETMGWPGFRAESSAEYQARNRWDGVLEGCASLGFDGSLMDWGEFVSALGEGVTQTIFAAESTDAPVQVTEPLESAGQLADGIWFLGADEQSWPGRGAPHPLLPIGLQRDAGMPHASPQADWALADEATKRLLNSTDKVVFSYPRQAGEGELRPSRLVAQRLGAPQTGAELPAMAEPSRSEVFEDLSQVPFARSALGGGAATLTRQSICPFQAFATARLGAEKWEPAETGMNALQRGKLLHEVLHRVWGGKARGGISHSGELAAIVNLRSFVAGIVDGVIKDGFDPERGTIVANRDFNRFSARFLKLEAERLTRLVVEWLGYELARLPFRVEATEVAREVTVAGVTMKVRLDRIDEMPDGSKLIVDYKSSEVGPAAWRGARPDDVQLPLYATYAVLDDLEGLVFGRVRPANVEFRGRVRNPAQSLRPDVKGGLLRDVLTDEQLADWHSLIEQLGEDFVAGRAEADPKDPVKTCANCHLQAVCRIYEQHPMAMGLDEDEESVSEGDAGSEGDLG